MSASAHTLSIIIPAYNEQKAIGQTLTDLLAQPRLQHAEIIVIDDGSDDDTAAIAAGFAAVRVIMHKVNRGYGAAVTTGIRHAQGDYIIWYDADGQHRPEDLLRLYDELMLNNLDYCIGVRDSRSHSVRTRQLGKLALRLVVNIAAERRVRDFNSGLRGFRRSVIVRYLHLFPKGFSASTTTTLLMMERGHLGSEIDIVVRERIGKSTVRQMRDGFHTMMIILRIILLFKPLLFFGTLALIMIVSGTIYGMIEAITVREGFPVFGALVIILGIQALFFGLLNDQISLQRRERFEKYE